MKLRVLTSVAAAVVLAAGLSACQQKAEEANTAEAAAPVEANATAPADAGNMAAPADAGNMAASADAGNMAAPAAGNAQ